MAAPSTSPGLDTAGKGIADSAPTFWTACQMLKHLGEAAAARRLMPAVEAVCAQGVLTRDISGAACEAVRAAKA